MVKEREELASQEEVDARINMMELRLALLEKDLSDMRSGGSGGSSTITTVANRSSSLRGGDDGLHPTVEMIQPGGNVLRIVVAQERQEEDLIKKVGVLREELHGLLRGDVEASIRDCENRMMRRRVDDMNKVGGYYHYY